MPIDVERDEGRPGVAVGAQDVRPEGRRRALRPAQGPARAARARSSTAAATSAACARARSTSRASSASARPREIATQEMAAESARLRALRDRLHDGLAQASSTTIYVNGSMEHRLPDNLNISFAYVEGESLLMGINDVAVSSGSACTSASLEPSYVLKALGRRRRPRALVDPLRPRPVQHRGRGRLRRRQGHERRQAAARDVAALRDGAGRRGPRRRRIDEWQRRLRAGGTGGQGRAGWRTPRRSSITTTTRATSASLPKDDATRRDRARRRAGVRRRDEAAGQGQPRDRRHRRRQVQDVRLRIGHRQLEPGHRVAQGQDASTRRSRSRTATSWRS